MELRVEMRAPGECVGSREGRRGHDMEGFAEVGRVLAEVHERAVQREIRFLYARSVSVLGSNPKEEGEMAHRSSPTA